MDKEELAERIESADVPLRYRHCRFENFDAYNQKLARKVALLAQLASERRGAFIFGPVGAGKTHLATGMLASFILAGATCRFIGASDFVHRVQSAFGNAREVVGELLDCHCVLIDDLGAERATEASRSSLIYLVDQLYAARKRIIVTSNQVPQDVHAFEPRIMSRLSEVCGLVELGADDYRIRTAEARQKAEHCKVAMPKTVN